MSPQIKSSFVNHIASLVSISQPNQQWSETITNIIFTENEFTFSHLFRTARHTLCQTTTTTTIRFIITKQLQLKSLLGLVAVCVCARRACVLMPHHKMIIMFKVEYHKVRSRAFAHPVCVRCLCGCSLYSITSAYRRRATLIRR